MRYLIVLLFAGAALAQTSSADDPVLQKLLSEVQQLRFAIERSTLLGARTQLAISHLQLQEARLAKISTEYNDARANAARGAVERARIAGEVKSLEERLASADAAWRSTVEEQLKQRKLDLDQYAAMEPQRSARESELASQYQAAQTAVDEARARISELERALDAAINQILKK